MATEQKSRLKSRPNAGRNLGSTTTGLRRTGIEADREGLLYVPESYDPKKGAALVIMLHGAGGNAKQSVEPLRKLIDASGSIMLAPESQGTSWDGLKGADNDVFFIDEALGDVFALYRIDPKHIAIAGFGDGGAYALNLAAANSDLFTHVMAFSPSAAAPSELQKAPPMFVAHGTQDKTAAIDGASRKIVPKLQAGGHDVTYQEFEGGHVIPDDVGRRAFVWFLGNEAIAEAKAKGVVSRESSHQYT